ncbi:hypothetical protein MTO96_026261 [Rhipicephalus appendiculatus]
MYQNQQAQATTRVIRRFTCTRSLAPSADTAAPVETFEYTTFRHPETDAPKAPPSALMTHAQSTPGAHQLSGQLGKPPGSAAWGSEVGFPKDKREERRALGRENGDETRGK